MNIERKKQIVEFLRKKAYSVSELSKAIGISPQALHRILKKMLEEKIIEKRGSAPYTRYILARNGEISMVDQLFFYAKRELLHHFLKKHKNVRMKKIRKNDFDLRFLLDKSALFSSKIEGNTLDLNSFFNDKQNRKGKEYIEILHLVQAYEYAQKNKLNEKNLLKAHSYLSKTLVSKNRQGKYRNEKVGVFDVNGLVYLAPQEEYILSEMAKLFSSIETLLEKKMSYGESYFWASWIHLVFVLIHPFSDGNGRVARLLEKWFLAEKNRVSQWYLEKEYFYFKKRNEYYRSLHCGANYWDIDAKKMKKFIEFSFGFLDN